MPAQTPGASQASGEDIPPELARPPDDSLDYGLPFLGEQARRAGADLPLPVGISIIGQYQREDIRSHNLQVGLGGGPLIDADFVGFNGLTTRVRNLIFRGDLWLFPFLNLYGLAGESWSSTTTTIVRPVTLVTETDSSGATLGFGGTLAFGIQDLGFVTLDANLTWADQDILSQPARTLTVTPRVGHRWESQTHYGRAFTLWIGATMESFENASIGSIPLTGAFPTGSGGLLSVLPSDYGTWYANLNAYQKAALNQLFAEYANATSATARAAFDLNVNPAKAWNMVLGGAMDVSKHWQLVGEAGLLGARTSVVGNICYRFGI